MLFSLGLVEIISLLRRKGSLGSLSSQSLGKYWQLNQQQQETGHIQTQANVKVTLINNNLHSENLC